MLKKGQNWGKIANYPPNTQQRFAPLSEVVNVFVTRSALNLCNNSLCRDTIGKFINRPSYKHF